MRAYLSRQSGLFAIFGLWLAACDDSGGQAGGGAGSGSFVEPDGSGSGSGSGEGSSEGSSEGSGVFVDTPVFLSVPPTAAEAGRRFRYEVRFAPADAVTLTLAEGPPGAVIESSSLVWDVPDDGTTEARFRLTLQRGEETAVEQVFGVRVGHAPAFSGAPNTRANRGEVYRFAPEAYDDDGDEVTLTLVTAPDWLTLGENDELSGAPLGAGAFDVTLVATDPIGLSTRLDWTIAVVESLGGLTAQVGYLTTAGGTLDLFSASMPEGAEVRWGDIAAARVERLSEGTQLRATFTQLPVGVQPVVVSVAGSVVGQLPEPLLVIPAATGAIRNGSYRFQLITPVRTAAPPRIRLPGEDGFGLVTAPVGATYSGDVLSLSAERPDGALPGGAATLSFDGIQSLPVPIAGVGLPTVTDLTPAEAGEGTELTATVAGLADGEVVVAHWSDAPPSVEATAVVESGSARFIVPSQAAGRVQLSVNGRAVRAFATSVTSPASEVTRPSLVWANREVLTAGLEQHLLVRGNGFSNPALELELDGGTARVVWSQGGEAVLALTTSGLSSAELRGGTGAERLPLWRFSVESGRSSAGERLEESSVGPGEQRPVEQAPVGTGVVVPGGALRAALASDGIWLSSENGEPGLGLELTSNWTRVGEPIPADKRALRDAAFGADGLTVLTVQGDLVALDRTGSRGRLTSPWTGIAPRAAALLSESRLSGASRVVAQDTGLIVLLPEEGRLLGVAPRDEALLLGRLLDAQTVAPLITLDGPLSGGGFLAANAQCTVFGDGLRLVAVDSQGRVGLDLALSGEAASSSGSVATSLGGGLQEAAMTSGALYLLDVTGQLLAISLDSGCVTSESTVTLVTSGLVGRRHLRSDGTTVVLSGHAEIRDGTTGSLLSNAAPVIAPFQGRVEDALLSREGIAVTDGATVAVGGGSPFRWQTQCASEGCAVGGVELLTASDDGISLLDRGDSGIVSGVGVAALRTGLQRAELSATGIPLDARVVGEVDAAGAMLTSSAGGIWLTAIATGALPTLVAPPAFFPSITLVGGTGSAEPAGVSIATASFAPRAAAYDDAFRLWLIDDTGQLWVTGGDGSLGTVTASTPPHVGCVTDLPPARDLALDPENRLLLISETGEFLRREESGAFCATGIGGLGSDPGARLFGSGADVRSSRAGLAIVRRATGVAIGLRPTY